MGHPAQCDFENAVCNRMIKNCPIMHNDVVTAYKLFGPDLAGVRGKTVQREPTRIDPDYVDISWDLIEQIKMITLTADIMFVTGIPFLIICGRGVGLIMVEWIPNRTKKQLALI